MNKSITDSIFLSVVQILNLLVSVVQFPYLVSTIGVNTIGSWSLVLSVTGFFLIVTDFSFSSSFLNEYVTADTDDAKFSIFIYSLLIKLFLIVFSAFSGAIFALFVLRLSHLEVLTTMCLIAINGLNCFWIFQAKNILARFSYVTTFFKVLNALLIILFIKASNDYGVLMIITCMTAFLTNVIMILMVFFEMPASFSFRKISLKKIFFYFSSGLSLTFTNLTISGYTSLKIIIVSRFISSYELGVFSIIDRLINILQSIPLISVLQVLYPKLVSLFKSSKNAFFKRISLYQKIVNIVYFFELVGFYLLHKLIFEDILKISIGSYTLLVVIFMINSFITNTTAFKIQYFLVSKLYKLYFNIHFYAAVVGVILMVCFSSKWGVIGGISAVLATSVIITSITHLIFKRHRSLVVPSELFSPK